MGVTGLTVGRLLSLLKQNIILEQRAIKGDYFWTLPSFGVGGTINSDRPRIIQPHLPAPHCASVI